MQASTLEAKRLLYHHLLLYNPSQPCRLPLVATHTSWAHCVFKVCGATLRNAELGHLSVNSAGHSCCHLADPFVCYHQPAWTIPFAPSYIQHIIKHESKTSNCREAIVDVCQKSRTVHHAESHCHGGDVACASLYFRAPLFVLLPCTPPHSASPPSSSIDGVAWRRMCNLEACSGDVVGFTSQRQSGRAPNDVVGEMVATDSWKYSAQTVGIP